MFRVTIGDLTTMQLAWMTDIHLNFLEPADRRRFLQTARDQADAFVISGDIAESPGITSVLAEMADVWQKPIHFVLGNHDFYRGSIGKTRVEVAELAEELESLKYLTAIGVVELSPQTAIVGHDGWADARLGDFEGSDVFLNDYVLIEELRKWKGSLYLDKPALREALNVLGDEAARHFEVVLQQAVAQYPSVIAVIHVPPFKEAAWYNGRHSDDVGTNDLGTWPDMEAASRQIIGKHRPATVPACNAFSRDGRFGHR